LHQRSVIQLKNTQSAIELGSLINTFVAGKDDDKSKE
ncbi:outer membrane lipid asymmetry maintenance protein MlaD, partial [Francisella tularensis]|nr:outer membrane lipid asymmetry maintenance protein MlaD [Francisella tularensis]